MNIAIIGMGPHGQRLFKASQQIEGVKVFAIIDRDTTKLQNEIYLEVAHKLENLADLWELGNTDALLIATNGPSHAPIALEALNNGVKRIMITKPIACSMADVNNIASTAAKYGARIAVDYNMRHNPALQWIAKNIHAGQFGKLRSVYIMRPGIGLGCLGVHSFDLANWLMGERPSSVTGWVDEPKGRNPRGEQFVDPGGLVVALYSGERRAVISQIEDGNGPISIEVNCQFARIQVDEKFETITVVEKDRNHVPKPGSPAPQVRTVNPDNIAIKQDLVKMMELIIRELLSNEAMRAGLQDGADSLEVLVATYVSDESGNIPIALPLTEETHLNKFLPVT